MGDPSSLKAKYQKNGSGIFHNTEGEAAGQHAITRFDALVPLRACSFDPRPESTV
jgi:hypothetical protein